MPVQRLTVSITTLVFLTLSVFVQQSAQAQFYKGNINTDPIPEPCSSEAGSYPPSTYCPDGGVPMCLAGGLRTQNSSYGFLGCFDPHQPQVVFPPNLPGPIGIGEPTDPEPQDPGEELDIGQGDANEMHGKACGGNPIDIGSGNKFQREVDYQGVGILPLQIVRNYNSKGADWAIHKGLFGQGWTSNFEAKIIAYSETPFGSPTNVREVVIQNETGHRMLATSTDNGTWVATNGRQIALTQDPDSAYWTYAEGTTVKVFRPSGHIDSITAENGEYLLFNYSEYQVSGITIDLQLDSVTHSSGASLTFAYDATRKVISITDSEGAVYTYVYNLQNLFEVRLPAANSGTDIVKYRYDFNHTSNLTRKFYDTAAPLYANWTYDSNGYAESSEHHIGVEKFEIERTSSTPSTIVRTTTNVHGKDTIYTFSKVGGDFRTTSVDGVAHGTCLASNSTMTYDAGGYYNLITDREGNVTDYDYDAEGQLQRVTVGHGTSEARTIEFDWDVVWDKPTRIESALLRTEFVYDGRGRVERITSQNLAQYGVANQQREWNFSYVTYPGSTVLQTLSIDGPRPGSNDTVTQNFNSAGLLTSIDQYVDAGLTLTTAYSNYDLMGRVGRITSPSGQIRDFEYDPRGRIIKETITIDGVATDIEFEYDDFGEIWRVVYSDGSDMRFFRDSSGRVDEIKHDDGDVDQTDIRRMEYGYDVASNVTSEQIWAEEWGYITDPNCNPFWPDFELCEDIWALSDVKKFERRYEYDSLDRLTEIERFYLRTEKFEYDRNDLLAVRKDGFNRATTYVRNPLNEVDTTTFRDSGVSETTFDANGYVSGIRDAEGQWTYYQRDGFGQIWQVDSPATGIANYEYDVAGNLTKKTDARQVELRYEYDNLNRLTDVYIGSSSTPTHQYEYDTDEPGYLYRVVDEVGTHTLLRDSAGRITSRSTNFGSVTLTVGYRYDSDGRLDRITYPSGLVVNYLFNSFGEVDSITALGGGLSGTKTVASNVSYFPWGPLNRLTLGNGESRTRQVDTNYSTKSLISGSHAYRIFSFDANYNILSNGFGLGARTYSYDEMDRVETHSGPDGDWEYTYDLNGNRTSHKEGLVQTNHYYNATRAHLETLTGGTTQSRNYDNNGNTIEIDGRFFDYDDLNRFWRYRDGGLTVTYGHNAFGERQTKQQGSTITRFMYDGPSLMHERVGSVNRDYIYLDGEVVGLVKSGTLYFVHNDHIGRPEFVTNAAKSIVWSAQNNAFGNTPSTDLIGNFNIGFPGQYYDIESGTYYNYFRTYDSLTGRYLQSDPIGLAGGLNIYSYANNNPINFIDPFGLNPGEPPPPRIPGGPWEWSPDPNNSRGGTFKDPSGQSASWDRPGGHWDVDDGHGNRQRYNRHGAPLSADEAHAKTKGPPRKPFQRGVAPGPRIIRGGGFFILTEPILIILEGIVCERDPCKCEKVNNPYGLPPNTIPPMETFSGF